MSVIHPQQMSKRDEYVKRILESEALFGNAKAGAEISIASHKARLETIVNDIVAEVSIAIGKGQREGVHATAIALGYNIEDKGSIAVMTRELVAAVRERYEVVKKK